MKYGCLYDTRLMFIDEIPTKPATTKTTPSTTTSTTKTTKTTKTSTTQSKTTKNTVANISSEETLTQVNQSIAYDVNQPGNSNDNENDLPGDSPSECMSSSIITVDETSMIEEHSTNCDGNNYFDDEEEREEMFVYNVQMLSDDDDEREDISELQESPVSAITEWIRSTIKRDEVGYDASPYGIISKWIDTTRENTIATETCEIEQSVETMKSSEWEAGRTDWEANEASRRNQRGDNIDVGRNQDGDIDTRRNQDGDIIDILDSEKRSKCIITNWIQDVKKSTMKNRNDTNMSVDYKNTRYSDNDFMEEYLLGDTDDSEGLCGKNGDTNDDQEIKNEEEITSESAIEKWIKFTRKLKEEAGNISESMSEKRVNRAPSDGPLYHKSKGDPDMNTESKNLQESSTHNRGRESFAKTIQHQREAENVDDVAANISCKDTIAEWIRKANGSSKVQNTEGFEEETFEHLHSAEMIRQWTHPPNKYDKRCENKENQDQKLEVENRNNRYDKKSENKENRDQKLSVQSTNNSFRNWILSPNKTADNQSSKRENITNFEPSSRRENITNFEPSPASLRSQWMEDTPENIIAKWIKDSRDFERKVSIDDENQPKATPSQTINKDSRDFERKVSLDDEKQPKAINHIEGDSPYRGSKRVNESKLRSESNANGNLFDESVKDSQYRSEDHFSREKEETGISLSVSRDDMNPNCGDCRKSENGIGTSEKTCDLFIDKYLTPRPSQPSDNTPKNSFYEDDVEISRENSQYNSPNESGEVRNVVFRCLVDNLQAQITSIKNEVV